jgi:penicillin-binding protein 2
MKDKNLHKKYKFFQFLTIALFCVLILRLATLQLLEASVYRTKAEQNQFRLLTIHAPRGDIVDRDSKVLAANEIVNTVSLVRQQVDKKDLELTIENLASLLNDIYPEMDGKYIKQIMDEHKGRLYEPVVIKRDVPIEVVARLEERRDDLPGVVIEQEMVRCYPEGSLASHLLGYIGEVDENDIKEDNNYKQGDLIGKFGLEKQYDDYLRGKNGFRQVEVDANERPIPNENQKMVEPEQGDKLVLTLDYDLQKVLEESMDKSLQKLKQNAGAAVVIDVKTGGLLAMTSKPGFDPNRLVPPVSTEAAKEYLEPGEGKKSVVLNRAISSKYPPGSTFKPVTALAALQSGKVKPSDAFYCSGVWAETNTRCTAAHGRVDLMRGMAKSCNIYFIEAGRRAGIEMLSKYIHELGLDEKTGVDLPNEVSGSSSNPEKKKEIQLPILEKWYKEEQDKLATKYEGLLKEAKTDQQKNDLLIQKKYAEKDLENQYQTKYNYDVKWRPHDTYIMSFGQGANEFTPLGLANYVAAIANGGKLMRPYLVQRIESPDGKVVSENKPVEIRRLDASAENLATVRQGMLQVTQSGGTAYGIFNDLPFKVAAKTGTAESGWGKDVYHGVFVAFAPADDPQIAFAGIIEEGYHGSTSVGPVANDVFKEYFGVNNESEGDGDAASSE